MHLPSLTQIFIKRDVSIASIQGNQVICWIIYVKDTQNYQLFRESKICKYNTASNAKETYNSSNLTLKYFKLYGTTCYKATFFITLHRTLTYRMR